MSSTNPKPDTDGITLEDFSRLLGWLDPDRDIAGEKYESIRKKLIKIFVCKGSKIPEELADATINRVATKLHEIQAGYQGDPSHYFPRVAGFIFLEFLRKDQPPNQGLPSAPPPDPEEERDYEYLQHCLAKLPAGDRYLITSYYEQEGHEKIDRRKKLAEELGVPLNALRIRACRMRGNLMRGVEQLRLQEPKGR